MIQSIQAGEKDVRQDKGSCEIIHVVLRSLGAIDSRLVEHGERVAFLVQELLECASFEPEIDRDQLFFLSALHDIGAYKTEEIDNMVSFETGDVHGHSVYGYLFLKYFTQFQDSAEAVLYHHTDFSELKHISSRYLTHAQMIFLADRIDILLMAGDDVMKIRQLAGSKLDPELVDLFLEADRQRHITDRVRSGEYIDAVMQRIASMEVSQEEVLDFLKLIVSAMDFRSEHTVCHTANTTSISVQLGEIFNLSAQELQALHDGASFHDIGKIAIPVEILEKTGKLTPEEMKIMMTHVEQTESILRGEVDDEICDIAVRHHERPNGKGYPNHLTAPELTLMQRIVAVADVLSALSGKRSYKERFPKDQVLSILSEMRERGDLCPVVCDAVFAHYDKIMERVGQVEASTHRMYQTIRSEYQTFITEWNRQGAAVPFFPGRSCASYRPVNRLERRNNP